MFTILGLITGLAGPLTQITGQILSLQQAKLKAQSDEEHQKIDAALQEAHDRKAILIAEAGDRVLAIINGTQRVLLAAGPTCYLGKLFIFDKVLGSFLGHSASGSIFETDGLDANLWMVVTAVLAFYFCYDLAAKWRK